MTVANISGQFRQMGFDIPVGSVPTVEGLDHKVMAQIMNARAVMVGGLAQFDLTG